MGYRRVNQTNAIEFVLHSFHTNETTQVKIPEVSNANGTNDYWNKYGFYNWINGPNGFRKSFSVVFEQLLYFSLTPERTEIIKHWNA